MKRYLLFLFFLGWVLSPAFGEVRYLIRLKNGGKVITTRYWEEKGQIKCQRGEVVVGFKKESVLSIEELKTAEEDPSASAAEPAATDASDSTTESKPTTKPETEANSTADKATAESNSESQAIPAAEYLKKRDELQSKIDRTLERFHQAAAAGDSDGKQRALDEINDLSKEVYAMEEEIKTKNKGTLPAWWKPEKKSSPKSNP